MIGDGPVGAGLFAGLDPALHKFLRSDDVRAGKARSRVAAVIATGTSTVRREAAPRRRLAALAVILQVAYGRSFLRHLRQIGYGAPVRIGAVEIPGPRGSMRLSSASTYSKDCA